MHIKWNYCSTKNYILLNLMIAFLTLAACAQSNNLIQNGGFEAFTEVQGWSALPGYKKGRTDEQIYHTGKKALHVSTGQGMCSNLIPYNGGTIKISGWVKTKDVIAGSQPWNAATFQLISYDENKEVLYLGGEFSHEDIVILNGTNDWAYFERTTMLSGVVSHVALWCYMWKDGKGDAWFDDISLEIMDEGIEKSVVNLEEATVTVDLTKELGEFRHLWIGSDLAYMDCTTTPTITNAMSYAQRYGFRYMRFHDSIVDSGLYSEDESGKPIYNWKNFDRDINAIIDRGLWPFVVLETMPKEIAGIDGGFGYTNPFPPKGKESYLKWQSLVYEIIKHCKEKWGDDIHNWYFEVWNEPDASGYFKGTLEEYLKIYDHAVAGAIAADPKIRIGGPAGGAWGWVSPFLEHCSSGRNDATGGIGCRVDFVSWHTYSVSIGYPIFGRFESSLKTLDQIKSKFPEYRELPVLITEWGCSDSEHPVHDTSYDAAFRTMAIRKFMDYGITLALPYGLSEGAYGDNEGFRGALGLFTKTTIPKPSFRAMQLLHRMVGRRIECDSSNEPVGGIACLANNGKKAWVILYNLIEDFTLSYNTNVEINFTGLPESDWKASYIQIAPGFSDPHVKWEEMGKPKQFTEEQQNELYQESKLQKTQSIEMIKGKINFQMPNSSVLFIELTQK